LVDFTAAEQIKKEASEKELIAYTDIMLLPQIAPQADILNAVEDVLRTMTQKVADKIKELNGGKSVSAVFVVGGGGKIPGYTAALAEALEIPHERVAIRGAEVMQNIIFEEKEIIKDSLLVTPLGICLNYYEQSNNFIFVSFNGQRIKIYDNNRLAVVDAAMQAQFPNDSLFPKRGKALSFYINGNVRLVRGQAGEAASITVNGETADIYTSIRGNDVIVVKESTVGEPGRLSVGELKELDEIITVTVNYKRVDLPKYAYVNGELQSIYYEIQENDEVELANFYTVKQIATFMDVVLEPEMKIYVNNKEANDDTEVYENFSVIWSLKEIELSEIEYIPEDTRGIYPDDATYWERNSAYKAQKERERKLAMEEAENASRALTITVNEEELKLTGKTEYVFVDIFEFIDFDLNSSRGRQIITLINGRNAQFMEPLNNGDVVEIRWK
jgi:hypothetical protein